jgi:hypothetical protein
MNSPVRTSAIGLLQHLQLLYLPSELDITKYTKRVYPTFDCNQTPDPVLPTLETRDATASSYTQLDGVMPRSTGRLALPYAKSRQYATKGLLLKSALEDRPSSHKLR